MDYIKLGEKAESFSDPITRFKIVGKEVKELPKKFRKSLKIARAITGSHLIMSNEKEYKEFQKFEEEHKVTPPKEGDVPIGKNKEKKYKAQIEKLVDEKNDLLGEKSDWEEERETLEGKVETLEGRVEQLEALIPSEDLPVNFGEKSEEELVEYYTENFEVNKDQIKKFKALSIELKVVELKELEKDPDE